ncbi:MAG: response regulator [Lachnospiraceae bacterium]|nr:response regulator [Lachnospiraceae bacterium]
MYKIMIADDEGIVIDSLKFILEKEFGKECVIEYAKTGRSVIELAETFRPDIAIMDIQMPGINGIDAMKEIRQNNRDVIFIVNSAYDKFDYATEAIKLGVLDYVTKPMEKKRIVEVVMKAMEKIDSERKKRSNELMVKEKLETVVPMIESGMIYSIFLQDKFGEDADNYKTILGIDENYGYMFIVVSGERDSDSRLTNAVGTGVKLQNHYAELRSFLKDFCNGIVGNVMSNKVAVLVPYAKPEMEYNERNELIESMRELCRNLQHRLDGDFKIGVGSVKEFSKLSESYDEALNALLNGNGKVAHVDDLDLKCGYEDNYPVETERLLFDMVKKGDYVGACNAAGSYFDWMTENFGDSIMDIRIKVLDFVLYAERLLYEKGGRTYEFKSRTDYLSSVMGTSDCGELKKWFLDKTNEVCHKVASNKTDKFDNVIEKAESFIKDNYMKDLSLDDISRYCNVSSYYFSKLFKQKTGENYVEYLNRVRIENAKRMLSESDDSIKMVCSSVGFSDPNYFSRAFKKYEGVTPTEYKEGKGVR